MNILPTLGITAEALDAEKIRMEIVGQNIANAQTTRGPDGLPYQRKIVAFETQMKKLEGTSGSGEIPSLRVAGIVADKTAGQALYNPGHPHADADGMVQMPNVNLAREMVDLVTSSRTYEANLSVVRTSRQMMTKALQIGR